MSEKTFCFEKNGFKVHKLTVLGSTYFIVSKDGRRYIRKSMKSVNELIG